MEASIIGLYLASERTANEELRIASLNWLHNEDIMYPPAFSERNVEKLFALIEKHSFGLLISQHDRKPCATHLPLLVDRSHGPHGALIGHMARANPQWQQAEGQQVLAVFPGPHAYISPTWYEASNVVPTWNYIAVHVYGTYRAVHDEQAIMQIVQATVEQYERSMPQPWPLDAASAFNRKLVKGIVGFRIEVSRIEGKLKLSQNDPPERREKVVRALMQSADTHDKAIAAQMKAVLDNDNVKA